MDKNPKHKEDQSAQVDEKYDDSDGEGEPGKAEDADGAGEGDGNDADSVEAPQEDGAEDGAASEGAPQDQPQDQPPQEEPQGDMMEPPGHSEWLDNFHHALRTHPVAYGMYKDYADRMTQGAQEQPAPEEMPPEAGQEAPPQDGMPPEGAPEDQGGAEGGEPAMSPEEEAAQQALSGGQEQMPEPTGDDQGVTAMSNNQVPVEYAEYLQEAFNQIGSLKAELQKVKSERVKDQKDLAKLSNTAAQKETELLVYQFQRAGIKKVAEPKGRKEVYDHLLGMNQAGRQAKAAEIMAYWAKDESVSYADAGAPVGDFVQVSEQPAQSKKPAFDQDKLEVALKYMRKTGKPWDECQAYAMNEQAVTN